MTGDRISTDVPGDHVTRPTSDWRARALELAASYRDKARDLR